MREDLLLTSLLIVVVILLLFIAWKRKHAYVPVVATSPTPTPIRVPPSVDENWSKIIKLLKQKPQWVIISNGKAVEQLLFTEITGTYSGTITVGGGRDGELRSVKPARWEKTLDDKISIVGDDKLVLGYY
jgi:hypothetical protein